MSSGVKESYKPPFTPWANKEDPIIGPPARFTPFNRPAKQIMLTDGHIGVYQDMLYFWRTASAGYRPYPFQGDPQYNGQIYHESSSSFWGPFEGHLGGASAVFLDGHTEYLGPNAAPPKDFEPANEDEQQWVDDWTGMWRTPYDGRMHGTSSDDDGRDDNNNRRDNNRRR